MNSGGTWLFDLTDQLDHVAGGGENTALRLEDGELSIAERELRQIQRSLMRAMRDNPDMAKMEKLMNELNQALDKFLAYARAKGGVWITRRIDIAKAWTAQHPPPG